jgi:hypothetical protein
MSHTFEIDPLSAVHGKLAADETVNRVIFSDASERVESATFFYCGCDAASAIRAATSFGPDMWTAWPAHETSTLWLLVLVAYRVAANWWLPILMMLQL